MKQSTRNGLTAAAVVVGIAAMAYFPYMATKRMTPMQNREGPLTASQRQRGMYMQAGVQDIGRDPDWDPVENRWKGWEKRKKSEETE